MTVPTKPLQDRDSEVFDQTALMHLVGGDRDLLKEIVGLFLETAPSLLQGIRDAAGRGDSSGLTTAVHALRGAARNFYAPRIEQATLVLEQMGQSRDLQNALAACVALETELDKLRPLLLSMLRDAEDGTQDHDYSDRRR